MPGLADLSDALQDYLREIYKLQAESQRVRTSTLARRMGVKPRVGSSTTSPTEACASRGAASESRWRRSATTA